MVMVGKSQAVYRAALHSFFSTYPGDINIILQLILYPQHSIVSSCIPTEQPLG